MIRGEKIIFLSAGKRLSCKKKDFDQPVVIKELRLAFRSLQKKHISRDDKGGEGKNRLDTSSGQVEE